MKRKITATRKAPISRSMGPFVKQVIPSGVEHLDPFVFLDHFGPIEKKPGSQGVPPHPHAGIATITYLFSGSNRHQDSYGHDAVIHRGDLAWMQAGRGIVHAEGMQENRQESETVHGLQLWISLPARDKFIEPDFFHYASENLPVIEFQGAKIKILAGELSGIQSPVKSLSPALLFEVHLPTESTLKLPVKVGDTAGIYVISGEINADDHRLVPGSITKFDEAGDFIELTSNQESHFMVIGGTPLKEPIVPYASFVMNSEAQIQQVIQDYHLGKMGTIPE